jgi:hypothetical protein
MANSSQLSINNTSWTEVTGSGAGSEAASTLPRGMWAIRRNGLSFILDYDDGGTVKNLIIGTVT